MKLEQQLKMDKFRNPYQKAYLNIIFTGSWLQAQTEGLLKKYGISPEQYNVLRILRGQQDKPIYLFEIQERMLSPMSNATRLVEKLRLKGLVTRNICEQNRRKVEILITEKGLALLEELDPIIEQMQKDLLQNVEAADLEVLNKILDNIRNR